MHVRARTALRGAAAVLSTTLALAACAGAPEAEPDAGGASAAGYPVEASSCGYSQEVDAPPERAITLNQGATEVALALGLQDRLIGTAYVDDGVAPKFADAYESVPVLATEYPDRETLLTEEPDFVYASYHSAFDAKALGSQADLLRSGIGSYLSPFACGEDNSSTGIDVEDVWGEVDAVARVFGVPERAERLREEQQRQLADVRADGAGEGLSVFWFDSGDRTAYAAAGEGGPAIVLDAVGAENVFDDVEGGWAEVPWEDVVAADPDVIVLVDASWSSAASKQQRLRTDPALKQMRAVREGAVVTVPFSESTPGVRLVDGARRVSDQLERLDLP